MGNGRKSILGLDSQAIDITVSFKVGHSEMEVR